MSARHDTGRFEMSSHAWLAATALGLSLTVSACGSGDSSTTATEHPTAPSSQGPGNALTVSDASHRTFTLHPDRVTCTRSDYGHGVDVLHVMYTELHPLRGVDIDVVPVDKPTTFTLPVTGGDSEVGPRNAFVFVGAKIPAPRAPHEPPAFENSTAQELRRPHTGGRLTVLEASCHPARLVLTIHGRLGSEYSDPDVTVSGGVDLTER
jgi:hypothetical protein